MWHEGEYDMFGWKITYVAKVSDEPSIYGIDEGRVFKLDLRRNGRLVASYDRGWERYPNYEKGEEILDKFLEIFA